MSKCIKEEVRSIMLCNFAKEVASHLAMIEMYKDDEEFVDTATSAMIGIISFMSDCGFISEQKSMEYVDRFIKKANEIVNA